MRSSDLSPPPMTFPALAVASGLLVILIFTGMKKRITIAAHHNFRCRFTGAIRIKPSQLIRFIICVVDFPVLVYFVSCYNNNIASFVQVLYSVEDIHRSSCIDVKSVSRHLIRTSDQRLCGEMKNIIGLVIMYDSCIPVACRVYRRSLNHRVYFRV